MTEERSALWGVSLCVGLWEGGENVLVVVLGAFELERRGGLEGELGVGGRRVDDEDGD